MQCYQRKFKPIIVRIHYTHGIEKKNTTIYRRKFDIIAQAFIFLPILLISQISFVQKKCVFFSIWSLCSVLSFFILGIFPSFLNLLWVNERLYSLPKNVWCVVFLQKYSNFTNRYTPIHTRETYEASGYLRTKCTISKQNTSKFHKINAFVFQNKLDFSNSLTEMIAITS